MGNWQECIVGDESKRSRAKIILCGEVTPTIARILHREAVAQQHIGIAVMAFLTAS